MLNILKQKEQIRKSKTFDDSLAPGITLETDSVSLEDDLNALRSQINRILDVTLGIDWYSDLPEYNGIKRGIKELNKDLADVESAIAELNNYEVFTPTLGQTTFTLAELPINFNISNVFINGKRLIFAQEYNFSGSQLTLTLDYILDNIDTLETIYQSS